MNASKFSSMKGFFALFLIEKIETRNFWSLNEGWALISEKALRSLSGDVSVGKPSMTPDVDDRRLPTSSFSASSRLASNATARLPRISR